MKRQASLAVVLPLLLLAACASEPESEPDAKPDPLADPIVEQKAEPSKPEALNAETLKPWIGIWAVTDLYGLGQAGPLGQRLFITENSATDLAGHTCPKPVYVADSQSEAAFLGLEKTSEDALKQPQPHLTITCNDEAFIEYLQLKDGSLLSLANGKPLRLGRQPETQMVEEKKASEAKKSEAKSEGPLVYLASYRDKGTAMAGWKELGKSSPLLSKAKPELTKLTIPGKGNFLRLQAKGLSEAEGAKLCKSLTKVLPDCGAKGRG